MDLDQPGQDELFVEEPKHSKESFKKLQMSVMLSINIKNYSGDSHLVMKNLMMTLLHLTQNLLILLQMQHAIRPILKMSSRISTNKINQLKIAWI